MFMMVLPGVAAKALFPAEISLHGGDVAYPLLVVRLLPSGVVGFMVAAMLAALMSSLASVFNSSSTLFAMDVWRMLRPSASDRQVVVVGRVTVVVMCAVGIAWIPVISSTKDQLFLYIQRTSAYLAPPISVAFCFSFWRRVTESATFWSLVCGLIVGLTRLLLDITRPGTGVWFEAINYLHFALFLSLCCSTVLLVITLYQHRRRAGYVTVDATYSTRMTTDGSDRDGAAWDSQSDDAERTPATIETVAGHGMVSGAGEEDAPLRKLAPTPQPPAASSPTFGDTIRLLSDDDATEMEKVANPGCPPVGRLCRNSPAHAVMTLGVVSLMLILYGVFG